MSQRNMTIKEFLERVVKKEIGEVIASHPYLGFVLTAVAVEFVGSLLGDCALTNNKISAKRFKEALECFSNAKDYEPSTNSVKYSLHADIRCGMAHVLSPGSKYFLGRQSEADQSGPQHLQIIEGRVYLIAERFHEDLCEVIDSLINGNLKNKLKRDLNQSLLSVPDTMETYLSIDTLRTPPASGS